MMAEYEAYDRFFSAVTRDIPFLQHLYCDSNGCIHVCIYSRKEILASGV
jgi:5'-3' exonuclease